MLYGLCDLFENYSHVVCTALSRGKVPNENRKFLKNVIFKQNVTIHVYISKFNVESISEHKIS